MSNHHGRQIVQNLWDDGNILRDDGLSYGNYLIARHPRVGVGSQVREAGRRLP